NDPTTPTDTPTSTTAETPTSTQSRVSTTGATTQPPPPPPQQTATLPPWTGGAAAGGALLAFGALALLFRKRPDTRIAAARLTVHTKDDGKARQQVAIQAQGGRQVK